MQIKTKTHINVRTQDGRAYAAGEGSVIDIDDDDAGMVGLAKSLIASGQAEHYGDAGAVDESGEGDGGDKEPKPEDEADAQAELDQLRAEAEAAGVKVDGRWGADRLREEIEAAGAPE